ncbi:MAG: hypothetical protein ACRDT4_12655 [Micromonosporaceae bacterium]
MDTITQHLRRALGNTVLVAVMAAAGVGIALTLLFWALSQPMTPNYAFEVGLAAPLDQRPELNPTSPGTEVQYSEVLVIPGVEPADAVLLESIAGNSRYLVALLTLVVLEVLCWRLLRDRPFSRFAAWSLGLLAVPMSLVAVVAPYLKIVAVQRALDATGLPTYGDAATTWTVVPPAYSWDTDTDWALLGLGLVCGLCAILLARGVRLQQDTEGLI